MEGQPYSAEVAEFVDMGPGVVLVYEHEEDEQKWIQLAITEDTAESFQLNVAIGRPTGASETEIKEAVQEIVDALATRWGGTFQCGLYREEDEEG